MIAYRYAKLGYACLTYKPDFDVPESNPVLESVLVRSQPTLPLGHCDLRTQHYVVMHDCVLSRSNDSAHTCPVDVTHRAT
jgi:hypothetical protein